MSIVPVPQRPLSREAVVPLTVEQYHQMIEHGILPEGEPIELLQGQLVEKDRSATGEDPMTVGHGHSWVVTELESLGPKLRRLGCHIRVQQPVSVSPIDEPEPDAAVVLGLNALYRQRHPKAADVLCVVEVADSSLQRRFRGRGVSWGVLGPANATGGRTGATAGVRTARVGPGLTPCHPRVRAVSFL